MDIKGKALFILLIGAALFFRAKDLTRPFDDGLRGECGAAYSLMAENMLRYGFLTTGCNPLLNTRPVDREHFVYYQHHPPTMVVLTAVVFGITGSSGEAAARIVPILLSLLAMATLFVLVNRFSGLLPAFCAAALAASIPLSAYYGAFLNFETFFIPFVLLSLTFYLKWVEDGKTSSLRWSLALMLAGALMDWTALIAGGMMMLDGFVFQRGKRKFLFLYPVLGSLLFAAIQLLFFIQTSRFGSSSEEGAGKILYYLNATMLAKKFDFSDFISNVSGNLVRLATWPVAVLAAVGLVILLVDLVRRRPVTLASRGILILLALGTINLLLFANHARGHDYWVTPLWPSLYWCAAVTVMRCVHILGKGEKLGGFTMTAAGVVIAGLACFGGYRSLSVMQEMRGHEERYHRGLAYRTLTEDGGLILTPKRETVQVIRYSGGAIYMFGVPNLETLAALRPELERYGYSDLPTLFAVHRAEADRFKKSIESFSRIATQESRGEFIVFRLK